MKVYLAGIIDGKKIKQCREWRAKIIDHYKNWKNSGHNYGNLEFLNPLNGEDNISADGFTSNLPPSAILMKDYNAIKMSDLFVANMDVFGVKRYPIGTLMEIAFAYEFRKPIILISKEPIYKKHPFVGTMVNCFVDNVDELLKQKIINTFYKAFNASL
jgi:nucleoside 2-deoxyribosyltransferase